MSCGFIWKSNPGVARAKCKSEEMKEWVREEEKPKKKKNGCITPHPPSQLEKHSFLGHEGHLQDRICECNLAWTVSQEEDKRNW